MQYESDGDEVDRRSSTLERRRQRRSSAAPDGEPILLEDIDTQPGALLPVYFQYGDDRRREQLGSRARRRAAEYADLAAEPGD